MKLTAIVKFISIKIIAIYKRITSMKIIYSQINSISYKPKTKICELNAKDNKDNNHSVYVHTMTMLLCNVKRN